MRARVLVLAVNDGGRPEVVAGEIITPRSEVVSLAGWEQHVLRGSQRYYGAHLQAHGFVDIEIPDDVIAQVLRRQADAGVVKSEPVEAVTDGAEVE